MKKDKQNIKTQRRKITLIVAATTFLIIGYALFAQPLAYDVALKVVNKISEVFDLGNEDKTDNSITTTTPESWNIKFTNAIKTSVQGNAKELTPVKFDNLSVWFDVALTDPDDAITYEFVISNDGTIRTKVDEIIISPESNDNSIIAYDVSGLNVNDKLYPGETAKMKVKIYYNDKVSSDIKYYNGTLNIVINFVQD